MARQKSRKTALKRFRKTNPKGNKKPKLKYKPSAQHHLKTKLSSKAKRRKKSNKVVDASIVKKYKKVVPV